MDDPSLPEDLHREALRGLGRLNRLGFADGMLWPAVREEMEKADRPLVVADLACGDGGFLRMVHRRAGARVRLVGVDVSPTALGHAEEISPPGIRFVASDVLSLRELPEFGRADVVTCSLFAHHLAARDIVRLLATMRRLARRRVLLNDLRRSWTTWWSVFAAARLVTRSPVVHVDSVRSVASALTAGELAACASAAGMPGATVMRKFPCRQNLDWRVRDENE